MIASGAGLDRLFAGNGDKDFRICDNGVIDAMMHRYEESEVRK